MKKALLFFALSSATLGTFTSCSRDDDSTTVASNRYNVTGNWSFSEYKSDGVWKSMSILKYYINLNADGTYTTNYLGVKDSGTYTYDGKDLVVTKSNAYDPTYIRILSIEGNNAQVELFNPKNPSDKIEFKLVK
ncbi:hypothetical protein [Riemerella phage vB_RanS_GDF21]|uniref:Lipocalin-like domain-containing protein n=1 Tax=Riemerella anatipestifer TaxID=34085 RepID=A0AAP6HFY7_RIEAN|nr:hypothetical protein [Riemerella anatipestifer]